MSSNPSTEMASQARSWEVSDFRSSTKTQISSPTHMTSTTYARTRRSRNSKKFSQSSKTSVSRLSSCPPVQNSRPSISPSSSHVRFKLSYPQNEYTSRSWWTVSRSKVGRAAAASTVFTTAGKWIYPRTWCGWQFDSPYPSPYRVWNGVMVI